MLWAKKRLEINAFIKSYMYNLRCMHLNVIFQKNSPPSHTRRSKASKTAWFCQEPFSNDDQNETTEEPCYSLIFKMVSP